MQMTKAQRASYDALRSLLREHLEKWGAGVYEGVDYFEGSEETPYLVFVDQYLDDMEWRFRVRPDGEAECFCSVPEHRLSPANLEGDAATFKQVIGEITKEW